MSPLLLAAFFLSGATSLVFEVVWSRWLTAVFGSTTLAISTVLTTFMAGLALGSFLGGRVIDRLSLRVSPLLLYAGCELLIAGLALLLPAPLLGYPELHGALTRTFEETPALLAACRFLLAALLLVPPATLMGATLPLLARHAVTARDRGSSIGRRVATLYAANTAGAVVGATAAGFYLVPLYGARHANLLAAIVGALLAVVVAGAVFWRRRRTNLLDEEYRALDAPQSEPDADTPTLRAARRPALLALIVSGAVAMTLEVLWSRGLALVCGSSIYSFTIVLVVFPVGLSGGAATLGRAAARARDPVGALGVVFLVAGAAVLGTHAALDDLPLIFLTLLEGSDYTVGAILFIHALLAGLAVLPTSLCLGAVLPLALAACARAPDAVARDVGRAYACNTVGAIIGSFAGGFVVLPLLGLELGIRLAAIAELLLAAALARRATGHVRRIVPALAIALIAVALLAPRWDISALTSGVFRIGNARRHLAHGALRTPTLLHHEDGASTTVTVERHGDKLALKNNGKVEASSAGDMPTQILVGLIPVLLHPGTAQRVAVIGYGSGVTVGAIAESPDVAQVDVVELEPAVYRAADRFFGPYNHHPERNPRVRRHVGDGRNFLTARATAYDVIVSEPSNPWIAGVSSLFTREFYAFARRHLAPGGVFCQWAQTYELGPIHVKTIYRTLAEVFPYVYAFTTDDQSADTVLIATLAPLPIDLIRLERRAAHPTLAAELTRASVPTVHDLVGMLVLAPDEVAAFTAGAPINTDDNALLEFGAPRDLLAAGRTDRFADSLFSAGWPYGRLEPWLTGLEPGPARADRAAALARGLLAHGRRREAHRYATLAAADGSALAPALNLLERLLAEREYDDAELSAFAGGPPLDAVSAAARFSPELSAAEVTRGVGLLGDVMTAVDARRFQEAREHARALPRRAKSPEGQDLDLLLAVLDYHEGEYLRAEDRLEPLAQDAAFVARRPATLYYDGRVRYGTHRFREGAARLEDFARRFPALVP